MNLFELRSLLHTYAVQGALCVYSESQPSATNAHIYTRTHVRLWHMIQPTHEEWNEASALTRIHAHCTSYNTCKIYRTQHAYIIVESWINSHGANIFKGICRYR